MNPLAIADGEAKLPNFDEDGFGSDAEIPEGLEWEQKDKKMPKTEKPTFEEVPAKSYSDYDSDDIAEIRAIGKKMLWKKNREEMLDASYWKYSYYDDELQLPEWFVEDQSWAYKPNLPITKAEVLAEKAALKEYNARPTKKEAEAKARKKRRMQKAMDRVRKKANVIANMEEINDFAKAKQIQTLYTKEKLKMKEKWETVVSRRFKVAKSKVKGKRVKIVDRRLKNDMWA